METDSCTLHRLTCISCNLLIVDVILFDFTILIYLLLIQASQSSFTLSILNLIALLMGKSLSTSESDSLSLESEKWSLSNRFCYLSKVDFIYQLGDLDYLCITDITKLTIPKLDLRVRAKQVCGHYFVLLRLVLRINRFLCLNTMPIILLSCFRIMESEK